MGEAKRRTANEPYRWRIDGQAYKWAYETPIHVIDYHTLMTVLGHITILNYAADLYTLRTMLALPPGPKEDTIFKVNAFMQWLELRFNSSEGRGPLCINCDVEFHRANVECHPSHLIISQIPPEARHRLPKSRGSAISSAICPTCSNNLTDKGIVDLYAQCFGQSNKGNQVVDPAKVHIERIS